MALVEVFMDLVTLEQLRKRAKIYTNIKGVEDEEWDLHINDAVKQYWNVVNTVLPDYNLKSAYFDTTSGTALYPLNSDVLLVRKVSCHFDGDPSLNSENKYSLRTFTMSDEVSNFRINRLRYRVWDGNNILFQPVPQESLLIVYYYLPVPPTLSVNSDSVNGISGLDVYISALAAKTVLDARRISNIFLAEKVNSFENFIKEVSNTHNGDEAQKIQDVGAKDRNIWWR